MNLFLDYVYRNCADIGLELLPYDNVIKVVDSFKEKRLSNIGIDISDGSITDIKIYYSNGSTKERFYSEKSISILKGNGRYGFRDVKKHFPNSVSDGIDAIRQIIEDSTVVSQDRYIELGKIIQKYTGTKIFPFFGGGKAFENNEISGYKLYYTFYAYDNAEALFGEIHAQKSYECIMEFFLRSQISDSVKKKFLAVIEHFKDKAVLTLLGINVDILGNEEYKLYFIIPDESLEDRKDNLKIVNSMLSTDVDSEMSSLFIDMLRYCGDYAFKPLELCLSLSNDEIILKSYFCSL